MVFKQISENLVELSQDPFGNFAVQKMIEVASTEQKKLIVSQIKGQVRQMSL